MGSGENRIVFPVLAVIGLGVLIGDIAGDYSFFQEPSVRTTGLLVSAAVRNVLTLLAVVALFFRKQWAAVVLFMAALLGGWRRLSFLLPISGSSDWLLVHSGVDVAFRILILGVALGFFLAKLGKGSDVSGH